MCVTAGSILIEVSGFLKAEDRRKNLVCIDWDGKLNRTRAKVTEPFPYGNISRCGMLIVSLWSVERFRGDKLALIDPIINHPILVRTVGYVGGSQRAANLFREYVTAGSGLMEVGGCCLQGER